MKPLYGNVDDAQHIKELVAQLDAAHTIGAENALRLAKSVREREILTAENETLTRQLNHIGVLAEKRMGEHEISLAENKLLREYLERNLPECLLNNEPDYIDRCILDSVATQQNKAPVLSETETQMEHSQEQINEDKTPLRADDSADTRQYPGEYACGPYHDWQGPDGGTKECTKCGLKMG